MKQYKKEKAFKWSDYYWYPTEQKGARIHPDKPLWWYDDTAVEVRDSNLVLKTQWNPKYFHELDIQSLVGCGLVHSKKKFGYGTFEAEMKLPTGEYLWPAFWMYGYDRWPPEIDVMEGYSNRFGNYFKPKLFPFSLYKAETTIHYNDEDGNHQKTKSESPWIGFKAPDKHYMKYKVEWFPDRVTFYYDDKKVREITDKYILEQLSYTKMHVLFNNGITDLKNYEEGPYSEFTIKYFKYTPYE